ncbi:MAG: hypothetical protein IJ079_04230 [Lachnospiraceae bacterium]|nr:hypothetical protein [Lachnospiraceae bacterium]
MPNKYKALVEHGVLLTGKVIDIATSRGAGEVKMEAAYFDERTGRTFSCVTPMYIF